MVATVAKSQTGFYLLGEEEGKLPPPPPPPPKKKKWIYTPDFSTKINFLDRSLIDRGT